MKKTLALALGAGGSRGVSHVGFLKALEEEGIYPDYIAGSSMGAVVGGAYSMGLGFDELEKLAVELKASEMIDIELLPITKLSLVKCNKMKKKLQSIFGLTKFDDLKTPFCCVATDILSATSVKLDSGDLWSAIMASSAIPTIFKPVKKDDMLLVDGGVLDRVPVDRALEYNADVLVAVDVLGPARRKEKIPNIVSLIARCYDVIDSFKTQQTKKDYQDKVDLWIEPDLGDMDQYAIKDLDKSLEIGYNTGKEYASKIKELLE